MPDAGVQNPAYAHEALPVVAAGRYRAMRFLGEGAYKRVFAARDTLLDREVALALIKVSGQDAVALERLRREAQAMAQFGSHPHIVAVFDVGEDAGQWYMVSELMRGGDLAGLLERSPEHRLPVREVIEIGRALCSALSVAHDRGIVHRDLKPGNVWLAEDGTSKLGDFGIAVALDRARLTHDAAIVGTPAYLSPEQALGGEVTPRADLYSLGVLLYELIAGRRPFVADDALAVIYQQIYAQPVAPSWHMPELPRTLEDLILRLLKKAPDERPSSAAAVAELLDAVVTDPVSTPGAAVTVLPVIANPLDRLAAGVFVGREREMGELQAAVENAVTGRTQLLLLSGEPGAGKTRTAEELATYARLRGMRVLWGRCYEEGAGAYWPWVQLLREWVREQPAADLQIQMGSAAADIAQLVSDVRERLPDLPAPAAVESDDARARMFDSIGVFLRNAARARPVALFIDDLQWADKSSLLLLQFLGREIRDARLVIVATYRDLDLDRGHPLRQALAELARHGLGMRITIGGLIRADVARLIELTAAAPPPAELVDSIYERTEGNPFFITEIVRLLAADGRLVSRDPQAWTVSIPDGVREVVDRRLAHLSDACGKALRVASVAGRGFDLDVLERVTGTDSDELLDLLAEAERGRVVAEDAKQVGRFVFTHALIRETLYDAIPRTRRVRLHRQVGEAIESVNTGNLSPRYSELAHHFFAAATLGGFEKAVRYARLAGDRARSLLAYEEAARTYAIAIQALDLGESVDEQRGDDPERCELLLAIGEAQNRADDLGSATASFRQAAEVARRLQAPQQLARAGLGMADIEPSPGTDTTEAVRVLQEALQALGDSDDRLTARVLGRLAMGVYFGEAAEEATTYARQAIALARRAGDAATLAYALHAERMVVGWADSPGSRLAVSTEIIRLAEEVGNRELAITGQLWKLSDLLELGDIAGADGQIEVARRLAEALRQPVWQWYVALSDTMRAMLDGRFAEAEQLAGLALAKGQKAHETTALQTYGGELLVIRREQGRLQELEPIVTMMVAQNPTVPAWRTALTFVHSELGRADEARREFERLASEGFANLPRDVLWLVTLTLLSEICAFLRDDVHARELYTLLEPYAGRNLVLANALACMGACDHYLGLLAETMGDTGRAAAHFEAALALHHRMDARPWQARTQHAFATLLLRRDADGDQARAGAMLHDAEQTAQELGMARLLEQVRGVALPNF